ncbi:MAG: hypothetical protein FK731_12860 [Asgard group archaeon]|nr:hypothetical protein [Asgard group archaeon]
MTEYKEIPLEDTIDEDSESNSEERIVKRSRLLSSALYKRLGIVILTLSGIILPLVILSFFFNAGQPDEIALRIEQITGFVLFGLALIVGISLLYTSRRLKEEEDAIILEPITNESIDETLP